MKAFHIASLPGGGHHPGTNPRQTRYRLEASEGNVTAGGNSRHPLRAAGTRGDIVMRGFAWWGHTLLAASLVVCLGAACNSPRQYLPIETPDGGGQAKDAPVQSPDASGDRSADGQKDAGVDM